MRVLIIEDESLAVMKLEIMLKEIDPLISICGKLNSIEETVEWFENEENEKPEIIFMDIQLSDGNSFEIFNKVKIGSPVVFTTAYDEYALKAFKVNSIDYLLKPINEDELKSAINKYKSKYGLLNVNSEIIESMQNVTSNYKSRMLINTGKSMLSVNVEDIAYFDYEQIVYLVKFDKQRYMVDYTLYEIEEFVDPKVFFRINRHFILNIKAIEKVELYKGQRLKVLLLPNHSDDIIVSQEKVTAFKKWLDGV